jgi:hypothetical protein
MLLLAGVRITWRRVAAIGMATLLAVGVFAAIDLARPDDQRSHLGRLVTGTARTGSSGFFTIIERKAAANLAILTSSVWACVIPVAFVFLAFLVWRPNQFLQSLQHRIPGLRPCLVGAVVGGALGFALNDSGVAVPAMMFAVLLPYVTSLEARPPYTPRG